MRRSARWLFVGLVALSLLAGIAGGLARVGLVLPAAADSAWLGHAALAHAALMIGGFLATAIGVERAVAVGSPAAFAAPLASGLAGACLLAGQAALGSALLVLSSLLFVAVNLVIVRRQRAAHTRLLLLGALAWAVGNALFALGLGSGPTLPWWFAFLVLTIAAERLEMTRLMRRSALAAPLLGAVLAALVLGAAGSTVAPVAAGVLYGAALALLALWLMVFDIARRTVLATALPRYMAACLLAGYAWLAVAGAAWAASALGWPMRDAALHALGLGFVFSMVMGHAPVILPAVARVKLAFGAWFYLPLAALHGSLLLRLIGPVFSPPLRATGAGLNAAALGLFAITVVGSALAWRAR